MQYFATELFNEEDMMTREADMRPLLAKTGCGLELLSFSIAEKLDRFDETLRDMQGVLARLGNPPLTLHGPFLDLNPMAYDHLVQDATFTRFAQAYEAARVLGAKKIIFHSCMVPTVYFLWGWAERMIDFWNRFLENRSGITVCMENVLDREFDPFIEVAEGVHHPDFGICLDIGHANCYSPHTPCEWANALAPYIRHLHVHDNDGSRDQHLACGKGTIPIREILTLLLGDEFTKDGLLSAADKAGETKESLISSAGKAPHLNSLTVEALTAEDAEESFMYLRH